MASRKNGNPVLPVRGTAEPLIVDRVGLRRMLGNISDAMLRRLEQSDPDFPLAFSLTTAPSSGCPALRHGRGRASLRGGEEGGSNAEIAAPGCHAGRRSTAAAHSQAQAHSVR